MVSAITNIAISGLNVASKRLSNSADNVANMHSTGSVIHGERVSEPYQAQQVSQSSLETGGVRATLRPVDPNSVPLYDPNSLDADAEGMVEYPNVDLEEEVVQQQLASYDFKANLKTLKAADEMAEDLLNITA